MICVPPDFARAYPEIFLLVMVCVVLLADLAWGEKRPYVAYVLAQFALFGCVLITFATSVPEVVHTFSGMFVDDAMADILKMLVYVTVSTVLVYSRTYIAARGMFSGEFFSLALFATLGMMVMISASHFLTLYLGLELLSLSQYAMVALRRDSVMATEAAIKFFVLGALASGFLLYGMSMVYGATGTLDITRVTEAIQGGAINHAVLVVGLVFIVAGISFKLSAAPFHMWAPDVYEGAPTAVVLFIGSAPKFAAFGFVMRLLVEGMGAMVADWQGMLIILAVMSMMIGNLAAIAQTNIKRMLAYSTISHMGFMLLGIIGADENGYSSSMFYILVYVLMTLGTFGMIMLLSREGFEAEKLDDFNRKIFVPQIDGAKTGLELPGIVDEVLTMAELMDANKSAHRVFVCQTINPWGYPAKDRSGRLDLVEEAHLGRLMTKISGPAVPVFERFVFSRPALTAPAVDTPATPSTNN